MTLLAAFSFAACSSSEENGKQEEEKPDSGVVTKPEMKEQFYCNLADWTPDNVEFPAWHQGMAICDNYLFTFKTGGYVYIYNMPQRKFVNSFKIDTDNHCNSAFFSTEKYSPSSKFPMLYLTESVNNCNCEVYDITLEKAKKVQDIILRDHPEGSHGAGWVADVARDRYLMVYDHDIYSFPLHVPSEQTVSFNLSSGTKIGTVSESGSAQAINVDNDYFYQLGGVGDGGENVTLYDLSNNKKFKFNLPRSNEPEGICTWNGHVYIGYAGANSREFLIYQTDFVRK